MPTPLPDGDLWFTRLTTERCTIEPLREDDARTLSDYRSDPSVAVFQDWPSPYSTAAATGFIAGNRASAPLKPGEWYQYGIRSVSTDDLIGDIGVHRWADDPRHLTVGFSLARGHWGQGLATEAVTAVLDHAVALTDATRLTASALAANEPSLRLLHRLGLARVGMKERVEEIDGMWHDEVFFERRLAPRERAIGAVLVGGSSTRMGEPKALVIIDEATMFDHVTRAMADAGLEVVVVGSGPTPEHDHPVFEDVEGVAGPAAGVAAVLPAGTDRTVFLTAVDQPYLSPPTIRRLLHHTGAASIPVADDVVQVTCAVYRPPFARQLADALEADAATPLRSVASAAGVAVTPAEWRSWGEDGRSWHSLDTPADVATAATRYGAIRPARPNRERG